MNAFEAAENSCKDGDLQKDLEVLFNSQNKSQQECHIDSCDIPARDSCALTYSHTCTASEFYDALAARRSDCGGWPKARMKARRIRFGSRNPVTCATRSIASPEDCTRWRATSSRNRSTAFDGVEPVSATKARVKCRELMPAWSARSSTVSGASRCSRAQASSGPKRPPGAFNSSS